MTGKSDERYSDPFKRILELWVLAALGALEPEDRTRMKELTPDLQRIYGYDEYGWKKIVENVMEFGPGAEDEVRTLWSERKQMAEEEGEKVRPEEFAAEFADEYFPDEEEG